MESSESQKVVPTNLGVDENDVHSLTSTLGKSYRRRRRQVFSKEQKNILESAYSIGLIPAGKSSSFTAAQKKRVESDLRSLADKTSLNQQQVRQWFINRRKKEKLHKRRVAASLAGESPYLKLGDETAAKRKEALKEQSGASSRTSRHPVNASLAGPQWRKVADQDIDESVKLAFQTIQKFLAGEVKVTQLCATHPSRIKCDNLNKFCRSVSKRLYGNVLDDAVRTIVQSGHMQDLINKLLAEKKKERADRRLRYTIIWVLLAEMADQPLIAAIIKDISLSLFKFTALDIESFYNAHIASLVHSNLKSDFCSTFRNSSKDVQLQTLAVSLR